MSKIRRKAKLKNLDGSYPEKSGVLSKSYKKVLSDKESLQFRIPDEFFHIVNRKDLQKVQLDRYLALAGSSASSDSQTKYPVFNSNKHKLNKNNILFDDTKNITLTNQKINPVLGITASLIEETKIFSAGNHFLTSSDFEINSTISYKNYDIVQEKENYFFEESTVFNESIDLIDLNDRQEIIIDLTFKDDLILDNLIDLTDDQDEINQGF